jgi:hypothetical protein
MAQKKQKMTNQEYESNLHYLIELVEDDATRDPIDTEDLEPAEVAREQCQADIEHYRSCKDALEDGEYLSRIDMLEELHEEAATLLVEGAYDHFEKRINEKTFELYAQHNENSNRLDESGKPAFWQWLNKPEKLAALASSGADMNTPNTYGETALHRASRWSDPSVMKTLIHHGADVHAKTKREGDTPLHLCRTAEGIRVLIEAGADIGVRNKEGKTPKEANQSEEAKTALESSERHIDLSKVWDKAPTSVPAPTSRGRDRW